MNILSTSESQRPVLLNDENLQKVTTANPQDKRLLKTKSHQQSLKRQHQLLKNKYIRAVPGGYYTGLINDIHKDYENFLKKRTCRQMDYLKPLIELVQQTSDEVNRFNEEVRLEDRKLEKSKSPRTLNVLAIQCTLPSNYEQLEHLSPLSFLVQYARPLFNRQQIVMKLIRKIHSESSVDINDAKEIVYEYFHHSKANTDIDELFHFLNIDSSSRLHPKELIIICCYAERYFLYKLDRTEAFSSERQLQEIIDFEFLKRKLDGLKLTDELKRLLMTFQTT